MDKDNTDDGYFSCEEGDANGMASRKEINKAGDFVKIDKSVGEGVETEKRARGPSRPTAVEQPMAPEFGTPMVTPNNQDERVDGNKNKVAMSEDDEHKAAISGGWDPWIGIKDIAKVTMSMNQRVLPFGATGQLQRAVAGLFLQVIVWTSWFREWFSRKSRWRRAAAHERKLWVHDGWATKASSMVVRLMKQARPNYDAITQLRNKVVGVAICNNNNA